MQKAFIVVDLGYGDSGKGTVTDSLVREYKSDLVVRYNGGSQCGHNVVTPAGLHHTFAQFGSGTLVPGVRTLFSRYVLVNPISMQKEEQCLAEKGVLDAFDRVYIDERALITTPYHRAINRLREMSRGAMRHGSCGKGIGETVSFAQKYPREALLVKDLKSSHLIDKLNRVRARLYAEAAALPFISVTEAVKKELSTWEVDTSEIVARYANVADKVKIISAEAASLLVNTSETIVFEGAQGVLLDEDYGFHPYTTWSKTTGYYAGRFLNECAFKGERTVVGVMRTYATRHGRGPFPTENKELTSLLVDPYNPTNEWQHEFRCGWLDTQMIQYAIRVNGGIDCLAITHLDHLEKLPMWQIAVEYWNTHKTFCFGLDHAHWCDDDNINDLEMRELHTEKLFNVKACKYQFVCKDEVVAYIRGLINRPILLTSHGPRADQKKFYTIKKEHPSLVAA